MLSVEASGRHTIRAVAHGSPLPVTGSLKPAHPALDRLMPATEIVRDFDEVLYVSPGVQARGALTGRRQTDERHLARWRRLGYPRDQVLDDRLPGLGVGR
jgi:hypothetical protein